LFLEAKGSMASPVLCMFCLKWPPLNQAICAPASALGLVLESPALRSLEDWINAFLSTSKRDSDTEASQSALLGDSHFVASTSLGVSVPESVEKAGEHQCIADRDSVQSSD